MLKEPYLYEERRGFRTEAVVFLLGAGDADTNRPGVIQAEHTHKVLAVNALPRIAHVHIKPLPDRQLHKLLYLLEGLQRNLKFEHIAPPKLYKSKFFVYNNCRNRNTRQFNDIIAELFIFSIDEADDFHKKLETKLVVFTMNIGFYTLGCKVNQYETQAMEQLLTAMGHTVTPFREPCDIYIINTCSVTAVADKKNRAVIRRCRQQNPDAVLAVCGCYPQHAPEVAEQLGADVIGGSSQREEFLQQVLEAAEKKTKGKVLDNALRRREFEVLPAGGLEGRTRAMLKVQDGCVNFCSYCIIPYTRGPVRSAPLELAVRQARELADMGYREIIVTGIEIASWGVDLPGKPQLSQLLTAVCQAVPHLRVRLGSLEPRIITEEFCQSIKDLPNLCPQFHLSMQSGCDSVLARMKRKYDTARYYESVALLKRHFPGCAVTTDMIVAFPGETEEEFARSLDFIQKCGFADMHIFPYSRRPGTPADKMPGQLSNAVKEERSRTAIEVADKMRLAYNTALIGTRQEVLFEEVQEGFYCGHAPNYVKVFAKGDGLHNRVLPVKITGIFRDGVLGTLLFPEI